MVGPCLKTAFCKLFSDKNKVTLLAVGIVTGVGIYYYYYHKKNPRGSQNDEETVNYSSSAHRKRRIRSASKEGPRRRSNKSKSIASRTPATSQTNVSPNKTLAATSGPTEPEVGGGGGGPHNENTQEDGNSD